VDESPRDAAHLRVLINQVRDTGDDRQPQARIQLRAAEAQRRWAADEIGVDIVPDNEALAEMDPDGQDRYLGRIRANRTRSTTGWRTNAPSGVSLGPWTISCAMPSNEHQRLRNSLGHP